MGCLSRILLNFEKSTNTSGTEIYFRPLADIVNYRNGKFDEKLASDLIYYSRVNNPIATDILGKLSLNFQLKIFGPIPINLPNYLGFMFLPQMANAFASAKICIDLDDTRLDAALNHNARLVNGETARCWKKLDQDNMISQIQELLNNNDERNKMGEDAHEFVTMRHTHVHLISEIFTKLDLREEAKKAKSKRTIRDNNEEYDLRNGKRIYVLAQGRLVNLAAAEGLPSEVMDMSFANQFMAQVRLAQLDRKGVRLENTVHDIAPEQDQAIARVKLKTQGIAIDTLTAEQKKYQDDYSAGT